MTTIVSALAADATGLQTLWFIVVAVLIAAYFILDGFDLGTGILYPFLARTSHEKIIVRHSLGPLWDGHELWLLLAVAALFAAFAPATLVLFEGFWLIFLIIFVALILRGLRLGIGSPSFHWSSFGMVLFFICSLVPALLFGVVVGNIIQGIPLNMQGSFFGESLLKMFGLFPLTCGLVSVATMMLQGISWQAHKAPFGSTLRSRAVSMRTSMLIITPLIIIMASGAYFEFAVRALESGWAQIARFFAVALLFAAAIGSIFIGLTRVPTKSKDKGLAAANTLDFWTFIFVSVYPAGLITLSAGSLYPNLVPSTGPGPSLSIASGGPSELGLAALLIIVCLGVALALLFHRGAYSLFRGRITSTSPYNNQEHKPA